MGAIQVLDAIVEVIRVDLMETFLTCDTRKIKIQSSHGHMQKIVLRQYTVLFQGPLGIWHKF